MSRFARIVSQALSESTNSFSGPVPVHLPLGERAQKVSCCSSDDAKPGQYVKDLPTTKSYGVLFLHQT